MKIKHILLTFVAAMLLASCGKSRSDLLDFVGADARDVAYVHPEKLMKEAGITTLSDIDFLDKGDAFEIISNLKGLDYSEMVSLRNKSAKEAVTILNVKDSGDLEKSLKAQGFGVVSAGGMTVYVSGELKLCCAVEDDVVFSASGTDGQALVKLIENVHTQAATPLPQWKRDILVADHAVNGIAEYDGKFLGIHCDIQKKKGNFEITSFDANGNEYSELSTLEHSTLGSDTDCLDTEALVSAALAEADYARLLDMMPRGSMSSAGRLIANGILKSIKGPVRASVAFDGSDFDSFQDYCVDLSLEAKTEKDAKDIVSTAVTACRGLGFYVKEEKKGFTTRFDGAQVTVESKGNAIKLATDHRIAGKKPSGGDVKGAVLWLSFNMPPKVLSLLADKGDFGLKGSAKLMETSLKVEVEVFDTDLTLAQAMGRMIR